MNPEFHYTYHALDRIETRQVSKAKVEQILSSGEIFSSDDGLHKAKFKEYSRNTVDKYVVIFSKQNKLIVTVEHNVCSIKKNSKPGDISNYRSRKIYKHRKRACEEREFNTYCREEFERYNMRFSA